ncbi:MAG: APC family permease [Micrococcaceae bacterium]|uniref:APC family permease n=1 Tax=unclassified Arthrobacter TaxID=235627 RepID=UPI0026532A1C|nr:APC family permease [Micrococcaceae bacterium]MDN5812297.1 APC family permease [Micrococcaceae bacterium]MDN5823449.1 APC family permease [Micrococcaceae bacterium]MDN5879084.1 APC family permease [Micrococcaceae bacterium]MDN5887588.1 APC family permease [Micrococcaceae bacterium]
MLTFLDALKRILVGRPFRTERLKQAPLRRRLALPLLSSNALSSVAYAPDEVLMTLAIAGLSAIYFSPLIGIAIMAVMMVIIASYRQSVKAYPSGRGDYEIASVNLGPRAGTTVASALLVDFVLTVAVSMSAAAHYVVAAFPGLDGHQSLLAGAGVVILALLNLRGLGRSRLGNALPTYLFIGAMLVMILTGTISAAMGRLGSAPSAGFEILPQQGYDPALTGLLGAVLVLRAFSTGSAALTGIEAPISNVQNLARPRARNAASILLLLGLIATVLTLGTMFLARAARVHMVEDPQRNLAVDGGSIPGDYIQNPVLSQLAHAVFGGGSVGFYIILAVTVAVLGMAGHSAFSSFPNLASHLATDGYLPRQLRTRGDRLGFSNGIIALGVGALVLVLVFGAHVATLIQLYVVGVFVSFTLSQLGMVRHWSRQLASTANQRVRHRIMRSRLLNLVGFVLTAAVLVIVLVTKFIFGAWLAVVAILAMYLIMSSIHAHYAAVDRELAVDGRGTAKALPARVHALILVSTLRKPVLRAVAFARAGRPSKLDAIIVDIDQDATERTVAEWERLQIPVPITVLASPYRETAAPIIDYIKTIKSNSPRDLVVVYIPEYVVGRWWEQLVHNQTALRIKTRLHFVPGVVVASVPWQLSEETHGRALFEHERGITGTEGQPREHDGGSSR